MASAAAAKSGAAAAATLILSWRMLYCQQRNRTHHQPWEASSSHLRLSTAPAPLQKQIWMLCVHWPRWHQRQTALVWEGSSGPAQPAAAAAAAAAAAPQQQRSRRSVVPWTFYRRVLRWVPQLAKPAAIAAVAWAAASSCTLGCSQQQQAARGCTRRPSTLASCPLSRRRDHQCNYHHHHHRLPTHTHTSSFLFLPEAIRWGVKIIFFGSSRSAVECRPAGPCWLVRRGCCGGRVVCCNICCGVALCL